MNSTHGEDGFSLLELLVSLVIVLAISAAMFPLINPAHGVFDLELERIDMQQRLRASADLLFHELLMAGAGATLPPLAPFRRGERDADPVGSVFADRASLSFVPRDGSPADATTVTYWLKKDQDDRYQLMRYDGRQSDLPIVDHVSSLRFDYFGAAGVPIDPQRLGDGPWVPDAVSVERFDRDLLAIRRVRVTLRVARARAMLPVPLADQEMAIEVSPRNMDLP